VSFQRVERAVNAPAVCIVSGFSDGPFIDCGVRSPWVDPHVYVQWDVAADLARFRGFVPKAEVQAAESRVSELEAENERLRAVAADADRALEAVHVLKAHGYQAQRKPGPKKQEVV
jgi:hypothetical protein